MNITPNNMNKNDLTEQDFLREKTRVVYESSRSVTDSATGEILYKDDTTTKKTSTEPDFIKVYYRTMMAVEGVEDLPLKFLLALSAEIGFANGDRIIFYNNKLTRQSIAQYCDVTDGMVSKYIKQAVSCGILFSSKACKGAYEVNPWLIAKGRWEHIKELQANFKFVAGKWQRVIEEDAEAEASENPKEKEAKEKSSELDGQMSLEDIGVTA